MRFLLIGFLFTLSAAQAELIEKDPYKMKLDRRFTHQINIRVLNHGLRGSDSWLKSQIKAMRVLYAQCGMNLKVSVVSRLNLPSTQIQDEIYDFEDRGIVMKQKLITFFSSFASNRPKASFDIHLVDYLNKGVRQSSSTHNHQVTSGIAFNPILFDWIIFGKDVHYAANSLFLAVETVKLKEKDDFIRINNLIGRPRSLSLLAHELGHLVLEGQRPADGGYRDHWCMERMDYCGSDNLMSSGGNDDRLWLDPKTRKIKAYDPSPLIDQLQCQELLNHPYLIRL